MMVAGRELPSRVWWTVGAIVVCLAILASAGIWYTHVESERSDRQWCELLDTLGEGYRAAPPSSETGKRVAAAIERLRQDKGCA